MNEYDGFKTYDNLHYLKAILFCYIIFYVII